MCTLSQLRSIEYYRFSPKFPIVLRDRILLVDFFVPRKLNFSSSSWLYSDRNRYIYRPYTHRYCPTIQIRVLFSRTRLLVLTSRYPRYKSLSCKGQCPLSIRLWLFRISTTVPLRPRRLRGRMTGVVREGRDSKELRSRRNP